MGEPASSNATVCNWIAEFKFSRMSTSDEQCSDRPGIVTNLKMIEKMKDIVLEGRRVKVSEIVEIVDISIERVYMLHENLCIKKLSARSVSRLLIIQFDQERN